MLRKYKRNILLSILPAFVIAFLQVLGEKCVATDGHIDYHDKWLYLAILSLWIFCIIALVLLGIFVPKITKWLAEHDFTFFKKIDKHIFLIFFLIIIILWIPALLASWPGVYSYDVVHRMREFYMEGRITAHFPIPHTLFLISCIELGNLIGGSSEVGVLIHSIIQSVLMALCFSYSLTWMYKRNFSRWIILIGLIFFSINPIIQVLVLTTTHDILYGGVLLVLMCYMIDSALYTEEFFSSKKNIILLSLFAFLMCMLRNQGVYMLILLLPFAVLAWKKYRLKMLISIGVPIVMFFLITGPLYSVLGIQKADIREALSVPMQQLGRVNQKVEGGITDEQYEEIYRYIPKEYLNSYHTMVSDTIKSGFRSDEFKKDPMGFVKVWYDVGTNNAGRYIDAFIYSTYGYYYMGKTPYHKEYILYDGVNESLDPLYIQRQTKFPLYDNYLREISKTPVYENVPVLRVILRQAFPFLLMIICIYLAWLRRSYKELVLLILPFAYWGTLILGPVVCIRYVFPLVIMIPIFLGMIFSKTPTIK